MNMFGCIHMCIYVYIYIFLSRPFTNHRTAEEGGGHFCNSSLRLSLTLQTLRH